MYNSPFEDPRFKRLISIQDEYTFLSEVFALPHDRDLLDLYMSEPKFAQKIEFLTSDPNTTWMKKINQDIFKNEILEESEDLIKLNSFLNSASLSELEEELNFNIDSLLNNLIYKQNNPNDKYVDDCIEEFSRIAKLTTKRIAEMRKK